ncbi:ABC transporter ATP-binding protein, partial [Corynebacterium diphtheriae]
RVSSARAIVHFVETMTGIRAVQAFRRQRANEAKYTRLATDYRDDMVAVAVRWYQKRSEEAYRRSRVSSARAIVHFVETMTGIRAVQAFRRQRANEA